MAPEKTNELHLDGYEISKQSDENFYSVHISYSKWTMDQDPGMTDCSVQVRIPSQVGDAMTSEELFQEALKRFRAEKDTL